MFDKMTLAALLEAVKVAREGKISDHVKAIVDYLVKRELKDKKVQ